MKTFTSEIIDASPAGFLPMVTTSDISSDSILLAADFRDKVLKNIKLSLFIGYDGQNLIFVEKPIRMINGIYFGKISKRKIENYVINQDEFELSFV